MTMHMHMHMHMRIKVVFTLVLFCVIMLAVPYSRAWISDCYELVVCRPEAEDIQEIMHGEDLKKAIADDPSTEVYAIYYYRPGTGEDREKKTLSLLNGRYGGRVKFFSVDVSKHQPPEFPFWSQRVQQLIPYVKVVHVFRAPGTGLLVPGGYHGDFQSPVSFTELRLMIDNQLALNIGTSGHPSDGSRCIYGWDWDVGARLMPHAEVTGVVAECHSINSPKGKMLKIKLAGCPTWFVLDRVACRSVDDLDKLAVGVTVRFIFVVHQTPLPVMVAPNFVWVKK